MLLFGGKKCYNIYILYICLSCAHFGTIGSCQSIKCLREGYTMIYDLQKASMWKRISAFLCDIILFGIVTVGLALLLAVVFGIDAHQETMAATCSRYIEEYNLRAFMPAEQLQDAISITITEEQYNALSEADRATFDSAFEALQKDTAYLHAYGMVTQLILLTITFSVLLAYLILEFTVPLLFKNGQTLGKKVFGVAVMRIDGVKLSPVFLLVRTLLGKYAVETMIPIFVILSLIIGTASIVTLILLLILIVAQIGLLLFTPTRTPLHDMLAGTVTVDFASQMIFDSAEELLEYKKKLHAESVSDYTHNS